jgi:hypothetical protein
MLYNLQLQKFSTKYLKYGHFAIDKDKILCNDINIEARGASPSL